MLSDVIKTKQKDSVKKHAYGTLMVQFESEPTLSDIQMYSSGVTDEYALNGVKSTIMETIIPLNQTVHTSI